MTIHDWQVQAILAEHPLYKPTWYYHVRCPAEYHVTVGFHCGKGWRDGTYYNLQIEHGICYLLDIGLEKIHRGKGLGVALYRNAEQVAKLFDCYQIRMTPSGKTWSDETRMNYVVRKLGYFEQDHEAIKFLRTEAHDGSASSIGSPGGQEEKQMPQGAPR